MVPFCQEVLFVVSGPMVDPIFHCQSAPLVVPLTFMVPGRIVVHMTHILLVVPGFHWWLSHIPLWSQAQLVVLISLCWSQVSLVVPGSYWWSLIPFVVPWPKSHWYFLCTIGGPSFHCGHKSYSSISHWWSKTPLMVIGSMIPGLIDVPRSCL